MSQRTGTPLAVALAAALGFALVAPALAFSPGGGTSTSTPSCKKGYVYDTKKQVCVQSTSSNLSDQELYAQGRELALTGRYQEALDALDAVRSKDSMTLTMIGYATRKSGDYDGGLALYRQALALDANNVNTREYLGEAYAEKGRIDDAKAELIKVAAIAGTGSEQYQDLAAAIAGKPDAN